MWPTNIHNRFTFWSHGRHLLPSTFVLVSEPKRERLMIFRYDHAERGVGCRFWKKDSSAWDGTPREVPFFMRFGEILDIFVGPPFAMIPAETVDQIMNAAVIEEVVGDTWS